MTRKHRIYSMALLLCVLWMSPALFAQVSVGISVGFAPPPLPVYELSARQVVRFAVDHLGEPRRCRLLSNAFFQEADRLISR